MQITDDDRAAADDDMAYAKSIVEAVEAGVLYEDKCLAVRDILARHREQALEKAAGVAGHIADCAYSEGMTEDVVSARHYTATDIVTAIRALKGNSDGR